MGPLVWMHDFLWNRVGIWCLILLGGTLSVGCGFPQLHFMSPVLRQLFRKNQSGGVTPFQALCTALGGSVGTGNLVGVAGAICMGGPGSLFWMWVCSFFAMAVKFGEALLSRCYGVSDGGERLSGPMYVLLLGMKKPWLARVYASLGVAAALGMGTAVQISSALSAVHVADKSFGVSSGNYDLFVGLGFCLISAFVLRAGGRKTAAVMGRLIPAAAGGYVLCCLGILASRWRQLGDAFSLVLRGAFSVSAVTGGAVGSVFAAMGVGCCKGMFSNEAGLGTAAMAYGALQTDDPVGQSMLAIAEVAIDTLLICTLSGLVILTSQTAVPYGKNLGAELWISSLAESLGSWSFPILAALLGCFSLSTVLTWGHYGMLCMQFLFGKDSISLFLAAQGAVLLLGAVFSAPSVWLLAETVNGLLMLPNLISLFSLRGNLYRMTKDTGGGAAKGGTYANIHQCQSL